MSESNKRRKHPKQTYQHKENAIHITVYDPVIGSALPIDVRDKLEKSVWQIAQENQLIINIAMT